LIVNDAVHFKQALASGKASNTKKRHPERYLWMPLGDLESWLFASRLGCLSGPAGFNDGGAILLGENKWRVPSHADQGRGLHRGSDGGKPKGESNQEGEEFHMNDLSRAIVGLWYRA